MNIFVTPVREAKQLRWPAGCFVQTRDSLSKFLPSEETSSKNRTLTLTNEFCTWGVAIGIRDPLDPSNEI